MGEVLDDAISLIGSRVALVAGPGVDNAFLVQVRRLIHSADPFELLVGAMTDAGLTNIPSLSCAVTERRGVRLIVRGAGKALVKTADGRSEVLTAKGISTWSEHAFSAVEEMILVAPNAAGTTTSLVVFLDPAQPRGSGTRPERSPKPQLEVAPAPPPPPTPAPAEPAPEPPVLPRFEDELDFRHLVEDTVYRGVEAAAVRPLSEPTTFEDASSSFARPPSDPTTFVDPSWVPPATTVDAGDHDGNTISVADLRAVTGGGAPPAPSPSPARSRGRLRFLDGQVVELDAPLVLGRQPKAEDGVSGARLVALADPDQSLSRSHLAVRTEGAEVVVVDLGSTNGTVVHRPGRAPESLQPREPSSIAPGTRVELADHVAFTYEEGS